MALAGHTAISSQQKRYEPVECDFLPFGHINRSVCGLALGQDNTNGDVENSVEKDMSNRPSSTVITSAATISGGMTGCYGPK